MQKNERTLTKNKGMTALGFRIKTAQICELKQNEYFLESIQFF